MSLFRTPKQRSFHSSQDEMDIPESLSLAPDIIQTKDDIPSAQASKRPTVMDNLNDLLQHAKAMVALLEPMVASQKRKVCDDDSDIESPCKRVKE